jgi:hypothetical protein
VSHLRLIRPLGSLLAVAAVAVVATAGIALATGGPDHPAKVNPSVCGPGQGHGAPGGSTGLGKRVTPRSSSHAGTGQCPAGTPVKVLGFK